MFDTKIILGLKKGEEEENANGKLKQIRTVQNIQPKTDEHHDTTNILE